MTSSNHTATTLHTQVISSSEELWALGPEWQALEVISGTDLPFLTWEWATSWWKHLHERGPGVRDSLRVCVVRTPSGEVVGIAPLMLTERPSVGLLRVRFLQFFGADPNITELRSMLCVPDLQQQCYQAVRDQFAGSTKDWDWIVWEERQSVADDAPSDVESRTHAEDKSAFVLALAASWDELKRNFGRNIKQSLRKCYNSLKRDGLTFRLAVIEQPREIEVALADFFELHAARANLEGGTSHANVFSDTQSRTFLTEVCRRLAQRGRARVFQLWVNEELVATRIGFVMGTTLYLYYSGWRPAYARYSVMTTLLAEVIKYAITQRLERVHLSTGSDVSKTRWGAQELRFVSFRELSPNWRAGPIHLVYQTAIRARSSQIARALLPAFLVRRSGTGPHPATHRRALPTWPLKLGAVLTPIAVELDVLDGKLDGIMSFVQNSLG